MTVRRTADWDCDPPSLVISTATSPPLDAPSTTVGGGGREEEEKEKDDAEEEEEEDELMAEGESGERQWQVVQDVPLSSLYTIESLPPGVTAGRLRLHPQALLIVK